MEPFLYSVAKEIRDCHPDNMEQVLVVFNNRRAGLFLRKQFLKLEGDAFFIPKTIGIDELVSELGNQQIIPHEFLLFELFDIHRKLDGEGHKFETFEEFIAFGEMMLADFSEIDLYCVDAAKLFDNLHELKELGEWDVTGVPHNSLQEKYLNFYRSLYQYYSLLRQRLSEKKRAYTGMAYRNVAENIDSLADTLNYQKIYFVGFNALSACEKKIIECLVQRGVGKVIFDGDDYYFSDPNQEAGLFLREHTSLLAADKKFPDHFSLNPNKKIHILNCPENILQAKAAGMILQSLVENFKKDNDSAVLEDTAIVLTDENLLMPMLNSLPEQVNNTNVTMGYPYTLSAIHSLTCKILSLYCHKRNGLFYHTDITALLSDLTISEYIGKQNLHSIITDWINKGKIIYANSSKISDLLSLIPDSEKIAFLFNDTNETIAEILSNLRALATKIAESGILQNNIKEREALACMLQTLDYFDELQEQYNFIEKTETLLGIYLRLAQRRTISFNGEPLHDLQILGMLETRSLDFKRVIMLSVNEGTIPTGRSSNSLIPLFLKNKYCIPTFSEKDAVYAYNFYRLLQRTDEAWLLFSSDAEGLGKGEPSRFILQIKNELALKYPNIEVTEEVLVADNEPRPQPTANSAAKDEKVMERLRQLAVKGFSPSALNRYRNCPMLFYYEYVLGLREQEEVSEELESNELGSFIHEILRDIYNIDKDGIIQAETLSKAIETLDERLGDKFKGEVLKGRSSEGKNHLYGNVAKVQIERFLQKELEYLKAGNSIKIVMTDDNEMKQSLVTNKNQECNIKGIADRVDIVNGMLRIADYKSGLVEEKDLRVDNPKDGSSLNPRDMPDKWFQVMTYAWIYCRHNNYMLPFICGIFPLRNLNAGFMTAAWNDQNVFGTNDLERFEQLLESLVNEIFDQQTDFTATPKKGSCTYCPFARTCTPAT